MADSLKIKVTIAGRVYPINVKSEAEEQGMRIAAVKINKLVTKFEKNYAVNDKQDVLAMCALQFASILEVNSIIDKNHLEETVNKINALSHLLDAEVS